jgi:hypothetical protein
MNLSLPGIVSLGHKTSTSLPTMFDGYIDIIDEILKAPKQDVEGNTEALHPLPSRICEISLGVLDSTLRLSQSHDEYKKELLLDNTFLSCNDDDDFIDEDLLSEGDIDECDFDDEVDVWGLDGHLPTPTTAGIEYEMPLVDTLTSASKYRHQQQSICYRKELLLDCGDDLDHILSLTRCNISLDDDELSQGDIESDCESDDGFTPESLSDSYYTMDRCIVEISP